MLVLPLAVALMQVAQAEFLTEEASEDSLVVRGMPSAYLNTLDHVRVSPGGHALTMQHSSGVSVLSARDRNIRRPESIMQFKLLGRTIRFTVDLSGVGCACNLAIYLIGSPAKDLNGSFNRGRNRNWQPPYYCDAQKIGGQWCPEIDLMEANGRVFSSTPHRCDAPTKHGHYKQCDREGCFTSTKDMESSYGPGSDYTINTLAPFDVSTEFLEQDGTLVGMRTTLKQSGRHLIFDHSNCAKRDFASFTSVMRDGMSLRISYWGSDARTMSWLDGQVCGRQNCTGLNAGDAVIRDISVFNISGENHSVKAQAGASMNETDVVSQDFSMRVLKKFASEKLSRLLGSSSHGSLVLAAAFACLASFMGLALLIVSWRLRARHSPQEFARQMPTGDMWLAPAPPSVYDRLPLVQNVDHSEDIA